MFSLASLNRFTKAMAALDGSMRVREYFNSEIPVSVAFGLILHSPDDTNLHYKLLHAHSARMAKVFNILVEILSR